jgi:hypothetical protein
MGVDGEGAKATEPASSQRVDCHETLALPNEPIPLGCEFLNERIRERAVAAPTLPDHRGLAGKFRWAVLCVFEEFEATCAAR